MTAPREELHELGLLEEIAQDPDTTQSTLAARLGVAVGTVNWYLKRLVAKGYVKVKRAERRKLRYILTPEGIALRAQLTLNYVENSMALYRRVREQSRVPAGRGAGRRCAGGPHRRRWRHRRCLPADVPGAGHDGGPRRSPAGRGRAGGARAEGDTAEARGRAHRGAQRMKRPLRSQPVRSAMEGSRER